MFIDNAVRKSNLSMLYNILKSKENSVTEGDDTSPCIDSLKSIPA
jgi:hypothetical protein